MSALFTFRAKAHPNRGNEHDPFVMVPMVNRRHLDINALRSHPRYRSYANSDLLLPLVQRDLNRLGIKRIIHLNDLPQGVTITENNFLTEITIDLDHGATK